MTDPVLLAQLDALDAQIELLKVQAQGIRHHVTTETPPPGPTARLSLPDRCQGMAESRCALRDDRARMVRGSFADPHAWQCAGCRYRESSKSGGADDLKDLMMFS